MYCRNCANHMDDMAAVCVKCGVPAGVGANYCPNCGAKTDINAAVCVSCGIALGPQAGGVAVAPGTAQRSKIAAGLLGIFLGGFGIHNFYLGFTGRAIIQIVVTLVTFGIGAIWGFIEGILILCGSIKVDANGVPLKD